jgi:hypothetical protein
MTEPHLSWRKSTYSGQNSTCVEVASHPDGHLLVRNSNHPDAGTLALRTAELAALLSGCRVGDLDHLT